MEKKELRLFKIAAAAGQFLSLLPFVIATEGVGLGRYVPWHYAALYAVYAVFYGAGFLCGSWIACGSFSKKTKSVAVFFSRAAVVLPSAAFIAVCAALHLPTALYLYAFPAAIIAFFGGYRSVRRCYSDMFSTAWFGLYFVAAIAAYILLWFTHDSARSESGMLQLCIGFAVLIVIAAVLTNQTNIDTRTQQRSAGKSVLPKGLRSYNAVLIAGICAVTLGLLMFAKPFARLAVSGASALLRMVMSLFRDRNSKAADSDTSYSLGDGTLSADAESTALYDGLAVLAVIAIVVLAIRFRKQIIAFFRELFAPLFKEDELPESQPFYDEITDSTPRSDIEKIRRRNERQLLRAYRRETDPVQKYRLGYALFLARLARTPFPALPHDTTTIHGSKGTKAFRRDDVEEMVHEYNAVRYGGKIPTEEKIAAQQRLLGELK